MRCAGDAFLMESKDFVNNSESFHQRIKVLATIRGKLFWTCVVQISSQDHPTGKITKKYRVRCKYLVAPGFQAHNHRIMTCPQTLCRQDTTSTEDLAKCSWFQFQHPRTHDGYLDTTLSPIQVTYPLLGLF